MTINFKGIYRYLAFLILAIPSIANANVCSDNSCRSIGVTGYYSFSDAVEAGGTNEAYLDVNTSQFYLLNCKQTSARLYFQPELNDQYRKGLDADIKSAITAGQTLNITFDTGSGNGTDECLIADIEPSAEPVVNSYIFDVDATSPYKHVNLAVTEPWTSTERAITLKAAYNSQSIVLHKEMSYEELKSGRVEFDTSEKRTFNYILANAATADMKFEANTNGLKHAVDCELATETFLKSHTLPFLRNVTCKNGTYSSAIDTNYLKGANTLVSDEYYVIEVNGRRASEFVATKKNKRTLFLWYRVPGSSIEAYYRVTCEGWYDGKDYITSKNCKLTDINDTTPHWPKDKIPDAWDYYNTRDLTDYVSYLKMQTADIAHYSDLTLVVTEFQANGLASLKPESDTYMEIREVRDFEMVQGWVPISVGGITTVVKGRVKKYAPSWKVHPPTLKLNRLTDDNGYPVERAITGNVDNISSARRVSPYCDDHVLETRPLDFSTANNDLNNSQDTIQILDATAANTWSSYCSSADRIGLMFSFIDPANSLSDSTSYGNFIFSSSNFTNYQDKIAAYDTYMFYELITSNSRLYRYWHARDALLNLDTDDTSIAQYYNAEAQMISRNLYVQMHDYGVKNGFNFEELDSICSEYFGGGYNNNGCNTTMLGFYFQPTYAETVFGDASLSLPLWWQDMMTWAHNENVNSQKTYISANLLKSSIQDFLRYAINPQGSGNADLFGCDYLSAYRDFTDRLVLAEKFVSLVQDSGIADSKTSATRSLLSTPSAGINDGKLYGAMGDIISPFSPEVISGLCVNYSPVEGSPGDDGEA